MRRNGELALGFVLGFATLLASAAIVSIDGSQLPKEGSAAAEFWLNRYQTLIAGVLAILGALIASRPAWRQLKGLAVQSSVMARNVLVERIKEIEHRKDETSRLVGAISNEFAHVISLEAGWEEGDERLPTVNVHRAFDAEKVVDRAVELLTKDQERMGDAVSVDRMRATVVNDAKALSLCLYRIHRPASGDPNDYEEEQWKIVQQNSDKAVIELLPCISRLQKSAAELDDAFAEDLLRLKNRVRQLDDAVVA